MDEQSTAPSVVTTGTHDVHEVRIGVMVAFLRLGRRIDHASSILLLGAFLLCLRPQVTWTTMAIAATFVFALAEKYFAWRVALDAELFALLQRFPAQLAAFDDALGACIGSPSPLPARSLQHRWLGARRLLCRQTFAFCTQAACLAAALLMPLL